MLARTRKGTRKIRPRRIHERKGGKAGLRFAIVFSLVGSTLLLLYSFPYAQHGIRESVFSTMLSAYAHVVGWFLRFSDGSIQVNGTQIVGRASLSIEKNCDAMDLNCLFAAAIVAFQSPLRRRVLGLLAGFAALLVLNIFRIVTLYWVLWFWPRAFELIHAEIWPLLLVLFAAALFVAWARWAQIDIETTSDVALV